MVATLRFVLLVFVATVILPGVASAAITVTASPTSVSGLGTDSTVVTAGAPVINAGIVQQEIIQQVDPSQIRVTGLAGITYPFGWTASYSMDGVTFGAAPVTQAGWNAIRAVKAAGPIESQGAFNGRQIATGTGTEVSPTSGSFVSTGGASGDGYDVFFDDQNHVFNVFHHDRWPNGRIDCHLRTGATCGPGWPFTIKGTTSTKSMAAVDTVYDHIWVPTGTPDTAVSGAEAPSPANKAGFVCVDIADLATGPRFCSGTFAASFIAMTASYMTSTQFDGVNSLAVIGSRMFAWAYGEGTAANRSKLLCLDMHANGGLGAACPGSPLTVPGIDNAYIWYSSLKASQGRLYAMGLAPTGTGAGCIVPATLAPCTGWESGKVFSIGNQASVIYEQPSATGVIQGVCFQNTQTGAGQCYKEDGAVLTPHAGLKGFVSSGGWPDRNPDTAGTRIYYANYVDGNALYCYDVALNSGAGASCPGWSITDASRQAYALVVDPYNADCLWRNGNDGVIKAYNSGGTVGCNSPPPWADLEANAVVPRMACDDAGAVREWRSFALTAPAANTFTTAKLTVYTAGGRVVVSGGTTWKDVTIPSGGSVDLSALSVSDSGVDPTFRVTFTGRSTWDNVTAKVTAVGDAPQLCVTYAAKSVCPAAAAQMPAGPFSSAFASTVSASGSATLADNSQQSFGTGSTGVTVGAAADSDCLGTISGTTTLSPSGAVAGVPVTLKDAAGNTIATTTTDASGNYSFTRLAAGSGYRVAFGSAGGFSPTAPTTSSASTDRSVAVASATTVNGVYTTVINAPSRSVSLPASTAGTFDPFALSGSSPPASPSSGQSFGSTQKALTRLCDPTTTPPQNGTSVPCTLTSRTTSEGTWTVNTTAASADVGKITFTPAVGFSGAATPMTYQVTDSGSSKAAGTLSPSVVGLPTATADPSSGPYNTPQAIDVLANDAAASGATLVASSVKLCDPAASPPENGSSVPCTKTSLTTAQGSYAVNATTGVVTFTPLVTFTGTAPSVRYQVTDSANQTATALITPTVLAPAAPTASAETVSVAAGAAKTFTTLTGASGLATAGGAAFDTSATCLVDPATPSSCGTSVTTAQGTWSLSQSTGVVTFTAVSGLTAGLLDSITYRVADVTGQAATSTLTPRLVGLPTATADPSSGPYNTPQAIDVLANDAAATGATLTASSVKLCDPAASPPENGTSVPCTLSSLTTAQGSYAVNATTGVVTFTPLATFTGTAPSVRYQVTDSANQTATALITPTVAAPAAPAATPETKVVARGASVAFTTLTAASGLATSGAAFTTSATCLLTPGTNTCDADGIVVVPGEGTWTLVQGTGIVTFVADANATPGSLTPIGYSVTDALSRTVTSMLTPVVPAPPVASDNAVSAVWNTPITIDPLANDQVDAVTSLQAATVRLCRISPAQTPPNCTLTTLAVPGEGTYVVDPATGRITFTPDPAFTGTATPIGYQVADGANQVTSANVAVTVAPVAPVAAGASAVVAYGGSTTLTPTVTQGTWPIDTTRTCLSSGATCSTTLTLPEGTYVLDPTTGVVAFTAAPGFSGAAPNPPQIVFTDTGGQTVSATLTVTVQPDPTPPATPQADPVALPDVESTGPGQPVTVPVLGNDAAAGVGSFDASSLLLRDPATGRYAKQVTIPKQGTFTVNADGTVTFTPVPGFTGTTTAVAYKVTDATGRTTNSTVQVIVHSGPPPWADPDYAQGPAGARLVLDPLANDNAGSSPFDPSTLRLVDPKTGKPTTRVVVPGEGTYVVDATTGRVTFTPKAGFAGTATPVVYTVRTRDGTAVESTLNPTIVASGPTLRIRTTASRAVLSVGQRTTITLRIANAGSATATGTVTRAMIPHGFSVVDRNGGTVHSSSIAFRTGSLKAGGVTMRTFVLIAGPSAIGEPRSVDGRSHGANVSPVADPVALRVVGGPSSMLPVTG